METAGSIIDRLRVVLKDENSDHYRWEDAELFLWLTDAQREIVKLDPTANPVTGEISLVVGSRQSIPDDGWMLLDVVRNIGTGRPVIRISKESYDLALINAYGVDASSDIRNYYYDASNRYQFLVTPQATDGTEVEVVYAKIPDTVDSLLDTIELRGVFTNAITEFCLYKAYMKDAPYAANATLAAAHYSAFLSAVGVKSD